MFRWDDLRVFLAVHRGGTVAAGARTLGIDASTVSRRLRAFEAELGATLFDRTPDGLLPTDLATRLLAPAEQAEEASIAVEAAALQQDRKPEGTVRLAVADGLGTYLLAPQLRDFLDQYPGIRLDVLISTELVDLTRREADVAVRFVRPDRGDLVSRRVGHGVTYRAFASKAYLERIQSLDDVEWIFWGPSRAHLAENRLFERFIGKTPRVTMDDLVVMVEAVRAGAGAMLLPESLTLVDPELVEVPGVDPMPIDFGTWIVTHRSLRDVPRIRAVMDWMADLLTRMDALAT